MERTAETGSVGWGHRIGFDNSLAATRDNLARSDGVSGSASDSAGWFLFSLWSSCSMLSYSFVGI